MGSIPSDHTATLRKTAIAALEAYNSWDIEQIVSFRAPSSIHEILPKSLQRPIMDFPTYRSYFGAIMPYFKDFHVTITDTVVDSSSNKVALWAKSTGSTDIGDYSNEYMLIFYFGDDGKIVRSLEFVDSNTTKPYMIELSNYIKEKKGSDGFEKRYGN